MTTGSDFIVDCDTYLLEFDQCANDPSSLRDLIENVGQTRAQLEDTYEAIISESHEALSDMGAR